MTVTVSRPRHQSLPTPHSTRTEAVTMAWHTSFLPMSKKTELNDGSIPTCIRRRHDTSKLGPSYIHLSISTRSTNIQRQPKETIVRGNLGIDNVSKGSD